MDFTSLFGGSGSGGSAPATLPSIGGSGKGASGAALFTGDNSAVFGNKTQNSIWPIVIGVAGVAVLGFVAWLLTRK